MSRKLNTFPLAKYPLFKLSKAGFVTADDLKGFKPNELAIETGLSSHAALEVLDIVYPPSSVKLAAGILSNSALDVLQNENSTVPITTSSKALDGILNGGIPMRKVTEICGCPGSGKTQLCMQLCTNVQIPKSLGGIEGEALYIDTEGSFIAQRLLQLASACSNQYKGKSSPEAFTMDKILNGVYYYPCKSYVELIARINLLPEFLDQHRKVSLIVVDSIAFHFRYGFDTNYFLRAKLLNGIMQTLVRVANNNQVAVVLTNHMTTKIKARGRSYLIPALGESWGHACAIRLILAWTKTKRQAHVLKSPSMAEAKANYSITRDGIRDIQTRAVGLPQSSK